MKRIIEDYFTVSSCRLEGSQFMPAGGPWIKAGLVVFIASLALAFGIIYSVPSFAATDLYSIQTWSQKPSSIDSVKYSHDPKGFIRLRLMGRLPDACHQKLESEAWIVNSTIFIDNNIGFQNSGACEKRIVPYWDDIEIDGLQPGVYTLKVKNLNKEYVDVGRAIVPTEFQATNE